MDGWKEGPKWGQTVMLDGKVQHVPDTGQTVPTEMCLWARVPALRGECDPITCGGVDEYD